MQLLKNAEANAIAKRKLMLIESLSRSVTRGCGPTRPITVTTPEVGSPRVRVQLRREDGGEGSGYHQREHSHDQERRPTRHV